MKRLPKTWKFSIETFSHSNFNLSQLNIIKPFQYIQLLTEKSDTKKNQLWPKQRTPDSLYGFQANFQPDFPAFHTSRTPYETGITPKNG